MITKEYQFPKITDEMHEEIYEWYKTHNNGNVSMDITVAIGGNITFEITPTSIGDFLTVKCTCGEILEYYEL